MGRANVITFTHKGDFSKTKNFLKKVHHFEMMKSLSRFGELGVQALASATPQDTGKTASLWRYEIHKSETQISIVWSNSSLTDSGIPVVVLIHYGHGTRNGGYVPPNPFITDAIKPIFDYITEEIWKEVTE